MELVLITNGLDLAGSLITYTQTAHCYMVLFLVKLCRQHFMLSVVDLTDLYCVDSLCVQFLLSLHLRSQSNAYIPILYFWAPSIYLSGLSSRFFWGSNQGPCSHQSSVLPLSCIYTAPKFQVSFFFLNYTILKWVLFQPVWFKLESVQYLVSRHSAVKQVSLVKPVFVMVILSDVPRFELHLYCVHHLWYWVN